ncbi:MAG: protein translocase subunit SecF [Chloroflexi bacterium]|nr:protein translocase subunit SecF [Chloroflexota bacterium]
MDFVSKRNLFFLMSLAFILPGVVFLIIAPGLKPGIDFTGGSSMTVAFQEAAAPDLSGVRSVMIEVGQPQSIVQDLGVDINSETGQPERSFFIRTKTLDESGRGTIENALNAAFNTEVRFASFDQVSPAVARETVIYSIYAVLAATAGIFAYIWWAFRTVSKPFRYSVAAVVALIHDVLMVIGIFAILGELADIEVNTMFLIALLTVIGYSVNDTVVVFDRIRENVLTYTNRPFAQVVNLSIGETMGRSLNTSLAFLFTVLALTLFGGQTIRTFLFVLLIGIVAGTYSSIAIASQILVAWEEGDFGRWFRAIRSPRAALARVRAQA